MFCWLIWRSISFYHFFLKARKFIAARVFFQIEQHLIRNYEFFCDFFDSFASVGFFLLTPLGFCMIYFITLVINKRYQIRKLLFFFGFTNC